MQISPRISTIAATILLIGASSAAFAAKNANLANPFAAGPAVTSHVVAAMNTSVGQLVVLSGPRSAYSIQAVPVNGSAYVNVTQIATGSTTAHYGPVRFQFSDMNVAWNNWYNQGPAATEHMDSEAPAQIYRMYVAAYGQAPDPAGLGAKLKMRDSGTPLREVAKTFTTSAPMVYLTNEQFLETVFRNVYRSEMPADWRASWISRWALMESAGISNAQARADFLTFYTEMETHRQTIYPQYVNGINYITASAILPPPPQRPCGRTRHCDM